ncbi:hypothetical protein ACFL2Q_18315 [Thermodesulfobacteriota bacterium]
MFTCGNIKEIERSGHPPVPLHLRNAPTGLMKNLGYGKGYKYAHDYADAEVDQEHLPPELKRKRFFNPTGRGFEATIIERMKQSGSDES